MKPIRILSLTVLLAALVAASLALPAAGRGAHDYPDLRGSWTGFSCVGVSLAECKESGQYEQNFTITAENFSTGGVTIADNGEIGQITGDLLTISWPESGEYLSTDYYKISPCGDSMAGTFSDSYGRSGEPIYVTRVGEEEEDDDAARLARVASATPTCKLKVKVSGKVIRRVCDRGCKRLKVIPVAGQQVELIGKKHHFETQTNQAGEYRFRVKKGRYSVHLLGTTKKVEPDSRSLSAGDDVGNLDFTLCKLPEKYEGKTPGCNLVKVEGSAVDAYGEPVTGPLMTTSTDSTWIENGHYSIYAERGQAELDVHRVLVERDVGADEDIAETFTGFDAGGPVAHYDLQLDPQVRYLIEQSKRGAIAFEAWNLPAVQPHPKDATDAYRRYDLEIIGANSTSPALVCSLDGSAHFQITNGDVGGLSPAGDSTIAEVRAFAYAAPVLGYEDHHPQYCEATYTGRLNDHEGQILARKALGDTSGVFKPKRSELGM